MLCWEGEQALVFLSICLEGGKPTNEKVNLLLYLNILQGQKKKKKLKWKTVEPPALVGLSY